MSKIRILGIEDQPLHQQRLYMSVEKMGYELIGIAPNKKEAMALFFSTQPDLILMDIALEGERDGIELAIKMNKVRPTPIIFTTSFNEKSIVTKASNTQPYAYLVKPIEINNLQAAIELAVIRFAKDQDKSTADGWLDNWSQDILIRDSFFTKQAGRLLKIKFDELLWIEVLKDKYLKMVTKSDELITRSTLKEIAPKLPPNRFIRIHRSYIVQAPYIESIDDVDWVIYIGGKAVPVGRTYQEGLLKKLNMI